MCDCLQEEGGIWAGYSMGHCVKQCGAPHLQHAIPLPRRLLPQLQLLSNMYAMLGRNAPVDLAQRLLLPDAQACSCSSSTPTALA